MFYSEDALEHFYRKNLAQSSEEFWIEVFAELMPNFGKIAIEQIVDIGREDIQNIIGLLKKSLARGGGQHRQDAFPEVVKNLSDDFGTHLATGLLPLLDLPEAKPNLDGYLPKIWEGSNLERREALIGSILGSEYHSDVAIREIGVFLSQHWAEPLDQDGSALVLDAIISSWRRSPAQQKEKIEEIFSQISKEAGNHQNWFNEICKRILEGARAKDWTLLARTVEYVPDANVVHASKQTLERSWNPRVAELLFQRDKNQGLVYARRYLEQGMEAATTKGQRRWIIGKLAEFGTADDLDILKVEIDGDSEECAIEAVRAVARIEPDAGQSILRQALHSRKQDVVMVALDELKGITRIDVETIRALQERTTDRDDKIKGKSRAAIKALRDNHIKTSPLIDENVAVLQEWLRVLGAFGADEKSGVAFDKLLASLGRREEPQKRLAFANAVAHCCLSDVGIEIAEKELGVERKPEIVLAWENALDDLRGRPDRSIIRLLSEVCDKEIDPKERGCTILCVNGRL